MTRNVFKSGEIGVIGPEVTLKPPFVPPPPAAEERDLADEVYVGPTASELRAEADEFRANWEAEKESLLQEARAEAAEIVGQAKMEAERITADAASNAESVKEEARKEGEAITAEAAKKAEEIAEEAKTAAEAAKAGAEKEGREAGEKAGFEEGSAEAARIRERIQVVLERIQEKRDSILEEAESTVVSLALLVTRKVVKILSQTQKEIVSANIREALQRVRSRGKVLVKVNIEDLQIAVDKKEEFVRLLESIGGGGEVEIFEDSSIDRGGCVVETDYGEIDARIASQLGELEARIQEVSPVREKAEFRE